MEGHCRKARFEQRKEKKRSETIKKPETKKFNLIFVPFVGAALRKTFKAFAFEDSLRKRSGEEEGGWTQRYNHNQIMFNLKDRSEQFFCLIFFSNQLHHRRLVFCYSK
jgi:hypothetical protein